MLESKDGILIKSKLEMEKSITVNGVPKFVSLMEIATTKSAKTLLSINITFKSITTTVVVVGIDNRKPLHFRFNMLPEMESPYAATKPISIGTMS